MFGSFLGCLGSDSSHVSKCRPYWELLGVLAQEVLPIAVLQDAADSYLNLSPLSQVFRNWNSHREQYTARMGLKLRLSTLGYDTIPTL